MTNLNCNIRFLFVEYLFKTYPWLIINLFLLNNNYYDQILYLLKKYQQILKIDNLQVIKILEYDDLADNGIILNDLFSLSYMLNKFKDIKLTVNSDLENYFHQILRNVKKYNDFSGIPTIKGKSKYHSFDDEFINIPLTPANWSFGYGKTYNLSIGYIYNSIILYLAVKSNNYNLVKYILDYKARLYRPILCKLLKKTIKNNNLKIMRLLLNRISNEKYLNSKDIISNHLKYASNNKIITVLNNYY